MNDSRNRTADEVCTKTFATTALTIKNLIEQSWLLVLAKKLFEQREKSPLNILFVIFGPSCFQNTTDKLKCLY